MKHKTFIRYTTTLNAVVNFQITPIDSKHHKALYNFLLSRFLTEYDEFGMSFEFIERGNGKITYIEEITFNLGHFYNYSPEILTNVSALLDKFGKEFLEQTEENSFF